MDWTKVSSDPNDANATNQISNHLTNLTKLFDGDKPNYVSTLCVGKNVLDIGAGEHDVNYFNEKWEHAIYKKFASKITAIEIDEDLCKFYNDKGFDFRCVDATSDIDIGEKFDFIYCGDVIEHVDNAVALMKFIGRHLESAGSCVITTPNPVFRKFRDICKGRGELYFSSNLQHVSWIVPTHMMEILRRASGNLYLESILIPNYAYNSLSKSGGTIEEYFEDFLYVVKKN